ncbi:MAG TPA: SAM-dependent methyltransferase [Streptosporangiaceae bacterium]|nr:SAM-dependent methyltransferase [Streptosporangiaceae bacterium]
MPGKRRRARPFVTRAVRYVAAQGITQYIDVGAGLPTAPAVHETAQEVDLAARVAYVDNDSLVLAHARALLAGGPGVTVVPGDMRDPAAILANHDLRTLIDLDQPTCILLASVLHFITPAEADASVAEFRAAIAPGSYLVISAGTSTGTSPALIDRLRSTYANTSDITGRPAEEIAAWFTGMDVIPPGLSQAELADRGRLGPAAVPSVPPGRGTPSVEHRDDDAGPPGHLRDGLRAGRAARDQRLLRGPAAVVHDQVGARGQQVAGHRLAHHAKPDKPDLPQRGHGTAASPLPRGLDGYLTHGVLSRGVSPRGVSPRGLVPRGRLNCSSQPNESPGAGIVVSRQGPLSIEFTASIITSQPAAAA